MEVLSDASSQLYALGWLLHIGVVVLLVILVLANIAWRSRQIVIEQKLANDYRNIKKLETAVLEITKTMSTVTSNQKVLDSKISMLLRQGSQGPRRDVNYDTGMFEPVRELPEESCEGLIDPDPDRESPDKC